MAAILLMAYVFIHLFHTTAETRHLHEASAVLGQTFTLPCRLSQGKLGIWWYQDSQYAPATKLFNVLGHAMKGFKRSGRFTLRKDDEGDYSLIIKNIAFSDSGLYTCVVDGGDRDHFVTKISVSDSTSSDDGKTITAQVGGEVKLPCRTAPEKLAVDWYYLPPGKESLSYICSAGTIVPSYSKRFSIDRSAPGDFSLVVVNVTHQDAGVYVCAEDIGQGLKHRITLNVHDTASSRLQHLKRTAAPEQSVLLPCLLSKSKVDWQYRRIHGDSYHELRDPRHHNITHNGVVTPQYSNRFQLHAQGLLIRDVQETDEGTYTCVDHRHRREIRLFVPCETIRVSEGQSVTLECQAVLDKQIMWTCVPLNDINNVYMLYWKHKIYRDERQRYKISCPESGVFDLTIDNVNISDAGTYRCTENDGHYPGEACTELNVIEAQKVTETSQPAPMTNNSLLLLVMVPVALVVIVLIVTGVVVLATKVRFIQKKKKKNEEEKDLQTLDQQFNQSDTNS